MGCCQEKYEKFKCSNGKCINLRQVCDHHDDCGNNDDENESRCPPLKQGMAVALENFHHIGRRLNCPKPYPSVCYLGEKDNRDVKGESFDYIMAHGRKSGDKIRWGDWVSIRYDVKYEKNEGNWLSCWRAFEGKVHDCTTSPCPKADFKRTDRLCEGERFRIYQQGAQGGCSQIPNTNLRGGCKGNFIHIDKPVYLMRSDGYFMSSNAAGNRIVTRNCPDGPLKYTDCTQELWKIAEVKEPKYF